MKLSTLISDNVTEVLLKVIEFTQRRQKVLVANVNNANSADFLPRDLDVEQFCHSINTAIDEHLRSGWLILRDTENIKFGRRGSFEAKAFVDTDAEQLRLQDPQKYLKLQAKKLLENSRDQKMAAGLLREKQGTTSVYE